MQKTYLKPTALSALACNVSNWFTQCPSTYLNESHGVVLMNNSLMGESWEESILMRVKKDIQYQSFCTEFAHVLQFHEELKLRCKENNTTVSANEENSKHFIYFTQPLYAWKIGEVIHQM